MPGISPKSEELAEDRDKWIMILSTEIIMEEVCDDGVDVSIVKNAAGMT